MPNPFILRGLLAASLMMAAVSAAPVTFAQTKAPEAAPPATAPKTAPSDPAATAEPAAQPNGAAPKRPRLSRTTEAIAPLKETIERMEESLRRSDLTDAQLIEHRGSIEPVRDELREIIASLEARLVDVDSRLKQLGDAPDEDEPKEDANLSAERARLQERRAALDGTLKQARLLILRAENLSERITERRRALFTQELLGRTSSALDPSFWTKAASAAPDGLRGVVLLAQGWMDHVRAAATVGTIAAASLALLAFFISASLVLRWLNKRNFRPRELGTRFAKSFYSLILLSRIAVTAPAVVAGAVLIFDAFGLLPERITNIGFSFAIAVAIAAFGRGVAVGLFAPDDSERRLLAIRDDTARLVSSTLVWAARVLGAIVFINVALRAVVAPVSLTVATSAVFSAIIAGILRMMMSAAQGGFAPAVGCWSSELSLRWLPVSLASRPFLPVGFLRRSASSVRSIYF
jgi:small-conductance mechanosensitive channel